MVSANTSARVRILADSTGRPVKEAGLSSPVGIVGWNETPTVGEPFVTVASKKEAEAMIAGRQNEVSANNESQSGLPTVPLLIKADVSGTIDAILHELGKFESDRIAVKVIDTAVGDVNVADVQNVSAT